MPSSLLNRRSLRTALHALLLCLVVLLSGCFDYRERITVREDGSALVEIEILIDRLAVAASGGPDGLKERISELMGPLPEGVSFQSYQTSFEENEATISLALLAPSIPDLLALSEQLAAEDSLLAGQVVAVDLEGTNLSFERTLGPGLLGSGSPAARGLGAAMAEGHVWTFELHVPWHTRSSTAHQVLPDGTLQWQVPMTEMGGTLLAAEFSTMPPGLAGLAIGLLLALVVALIWRKRRTALA